MENIVSVPGKKFKLDLEWKTREQEVRWKKLLNDLRKAEIRIKIKTLSKICRGIDFSYHKKISILSLFVSEIRKMTDSVLKTIS